MQDSVSCWGTDGDTLNRKGVELAENSGCMALYSCVVRGQLQRAIAAGGKLQTCSEVHEARMVLTIAEEAALEEWCLVIYRWGSPVRLDILRCIAATMLEDRERRNIESAPNFLKRILDLLQLIPL